MSRMKLLRYWMAVVSCSLVLSLSTAAVGWSQETPTPDAAAAPDADLPGPPEPATAAPTAEEPAPDQPVVREAPEAAQQEEAEAEQAQAEDEVAERNAPIDPPMQMHDDVIDDDPAEVLEEAAEELDPAAVAAEQGLSPLLLFIIVIAVVVLPFWIGSLMAKKLRMQEYGWKIGLALGTLVAGTVICYFGWPPHLGPDLSGGINLIYEVDPEEEEIDTEKLIAALRRRINQGGVKEVTIRPYGSRQIEIIIPKADDAEVDIVKNKITTAGALEFRIVANRQDHVQIIEAAREVEGRQVEVGGAVVAMWVGLDPEQFDPARTAQFTTRQNARGETEVLVVMDDYDVTGEYLETATSGIDQGGRPAVNFSFNAQGARRFGHLTTENAPNPGTGFTRDLGIVLDNTLLSAPSLNEPITQGRGQISGGSFTPEEVEFLISILNAGSLPAALSETPISEQVTSPTLGADTVERGAWAMIASIIAVMLFVLVYYRFAGLVACMALVINLVLLLAVMILINAAFTLPGIAGLVLTIGMAVDANVLIYERIREELSRGAALRMAIRNGFDRATTTIVDSNMTTLITAIVLYWIGTDQIKGFAVTLILGIVMSMYTAVFLGRIVFEIAERKRWITDMHMMRLWGNTQWDFVGKRNLCIAASLVLIAIGFVAVAARGKTLLDIDFTGGSSVTVAFIEPQEIREVRDEVEQAAEELAERARPAVEAYQDAVDEGEGREESLPEEVQSLGQLQLPVEFTVVGVGEDDRLFKIDTSIRDFSIAQQMLESQFDGRLVTNHLDYTPLQTAGEAVGGQRSAVSKSDTQFVAFLQDEEQAAPDALSPDAATEQAPQESTAAGGDVRTTTTLQFGEPIKHDTLVQLFENAFVEAGLPEVSFTITDQQHQIGSDVARTEWDLSVAMPAEQTEQLLATLGAAIEDATVFPSSSNIGGQVAADMQVQAGYAMFGSVLCIIGYVWIRFQRIMYGLAAVVALIHDVLITIGALALSKYIVLYLDPVAAALMIDPFKINLAIVAALLTVVGYSINDTIVIFDRIREVRGKSPDLTPEMVNVSINQTMSRTLLTAITTLLVLLILYIWGGPGIHGFAFALLVGCSMGVYSTVFIAAPIVLWMTGSPGEKTTRRTAEAARA